jgi:CheY-like chemotaxis protein
MTSILFVDDEPLLLKAIARGFRRDQERWRMVFVGSALEALQACELETFDVIVSDFRMPGMDGAAFLERVRQTHRTTARVMLSGNVIPAFDRMAHAFAHELLSKPCPIDDLRACIERQLASEKTSSARFRTAVRAMSGQFRM